MQLVEAAKDVEDFVATVEKMLQLCDIWAERIKENLGCSDGDNMVEPFIGHEVLRA